MAPENELDDDGRCSPEVDDDPAADAQDEERTDDASMASRVRRWTPRPRA